MGRVDEYIGLVDDPRAPALVPGNPADNALLALLAHMAFADGEVEEHELAWLARVLPGRDPDALRAWAIESGRRPLDLAAVARALPSTEERLKCLRFAVRMAWKDGRLQPEEEALLARLAQALQLPASALEGVQDEVWARGAVAVEPDAVHAALFGVDWDAVERFEGPLTGDLAEIVPAGATAIGGAAIDRQETIGLYLEGIAGRFREGIAWIPWADLVAFTRQATLGGAVHLLTEDGHRWTLLDFRLAGLGMVLARLHERRAGRTPPPRIELIRGD